VDSGLVSDSLSAFLKGSGDEPATTPLPTYTDKFNELCPLYISMGMTAEQFWYGDCTLVVHYRKAYELSQERHNQELWLQGRYFYDALCAVSPILQAFAKKGTRPKPYLSEPYTLTSKQAEKKEEDKDRKVYNKGKSLIERLMVDTNKKFDKRPKV
jgi:hypothetical protein